MGSERGVGGAVHTIEEEGAGAAFTIVSRSDAGAPTDPGDGVVYFAYRRTAFRLSFNSRAMRRSDQPRAASVWIVLIIGALRRFIAPFSADSPAVAQWLLKVAYFDPVPNWYPLAVPRHDRAGSQQPASGGQRRADAEGRGGI